MFERNCMTYNSFKFFKPYFKFFKICKIVMKASHAFDAVYKVFTAKGIQYNKISTDAARVFQNNFHSIFSNAPSVWKAL